MRLTIAAMLLFSAGTAVADCYCTCVNGRNQAICESTIDLPPVCGPKMCPLEPPSLRPLSPPTLPPLGTRVCRQEQVWDHNYSKYVWKQICR
jgi:hypothetical protein